MNEIIRNQRGINTANLIDGRSTNDLRIHNCYITFFLVNHLFVGWMRATKTIKI